MIYNAAKRVLCTLSQGRKREGSRSPSSRCCSPPPRSSADLLSRASGNPSSSAMESEKGQPLPKFGEWDVNNPASAEGYTMIFNKARDEKKTGGNTGTPSTPTRKDAGGLQADDSYQYPKKSRKWLCCG